MIYIEPEHRLTISLTNTSEGNDITTFCNIINKCYKEAKRAGFKGMFTGEEKVVIKAITESLGLDDKKADGFQQNIGSVVHVKDLE